MLNEARNGRLVRRNDNMGRRPDFVVPRPDLDDDDDLNDEVPVLMQVARNGNLVRM